MDQWEPLQLPPEPDHLPLDDDPRIHGSGSTLDLQDSAANTSVLGSAWANVQPYFSMSSSNGYYYQTQNGATFGIAW